MNQFVQINSKTTQKMSIIKRKATSLDPVQRQRKNKRTQYFALLENCLQIPNDDKLILRKGVTEYEESLISLLQKYRKQSSKDLKDLQIFLRKYIQKYKNEHPKYPTLKLTRGTQSCLSLQKRQSSIIFSINKSKVSLRTNNNTSNLKSAFYMQQSQSIIPSSNKNMNKHFCKEQERNYELMIQRRKKQKLKISHNRVSITIDNESSFQAISKDIQIMRLQKDTKIKNRLGKSNALTFQDAKSIQQLTQKPMKTQQIFQHIDKNDFLQSLRFRMKVDSDEQAQEPIPKLIKIRPQQKQVLVIVTGDSICQSKLVQRVSCQSQNLQKSFQIKRKLFQDGQQSVRNSLGDSQENKLNESLDQITKQPLSQIYSGCNYQELNKNSIIDQNEYLNRREKFEQGNKCQDFPGNDFISQSKASRSFRKQQTQNSVRLNSLIAVNSGNKQNETSSYLLNINTQMKKSSVFSHRPFNETNSSQIYAAKDQKQSRSSRMQFSNRIQQIISGKKETNDIQNSNLQRSHCMSPSYSFRQKKKAVSKLEFWNRIQSAINS